MYIKPVALSFVAFLVSAIVAGLKSVGALNAVADYPWVAIVFTAISFAIFASICFRQVVTASGIKFMQAMQIVFAATILLVE